MYLLRNNQAKQRQQGDTSTTEGTPSSTTPVTPAEPETVPPENSYAMTGTNGTLYAYNMSGKSVSFWFTPSKNYAKCSLYCSLGNATGLVAADKTMSKDDKGTWTYTVTSDSYTAGAKIYAIIITNTGKSVPQGTVGDASCSDWVCFTYGATGSYVFSQPEDDGASSSEVESVTISGSTGVTPGGTIALSAEVLPATAVDKTVTWEVVSGNAYASVSASGIVTGISPGTAVIQAKAGDRRDAYTIKVSLSGGEIVSGKTLANTDFTKLTPVSLGSGKEMTMRFLNCTNGQYTDDRIYICCIGLNDGGAWCYLKPDGTAVPAGTSSSSGWSFRLSALPSGAYQIPMTLTSARVYVSYDKPLVMNGTGSGIALPDIANSSDVNISTVFDWIEFTVKKGGFWGNTTQVDEFSIPLVMAMYDDDGFYQMVGIKKTREEITALFRHDLPAEFQSLVQSNRIVAPLRGNFSKGKTNGNYMKEYVDEVWSYYQTHTETLVHDLGTFSISCDGTRLVFTCTKTNGIAAAGQKYYVTGKPDNDEVLGGSGVLASGNLVELGLQAQLCGALNRHVATEPAHWKEPSSYYLSSPCNYYAGFWHYYNIDSKAYGFCYDDVSDQAPLIQTGTPRELVIGIGY
jgi:hypothetical protein